MLKRSTWILACLFFLNGAMPTTLFASNPQAEVPKQPNIIFIMADDLGYGDVGCYGQDRIRTPQMDRMAQEGIRFTDVYAGSTVCAPSRCALMTGLNTGHARVRGNARVPLLPEDVTVAEVLREAGYQTALYGKWGLGEADSTGIPNRQGFERFFGYLNQVNAHNYYPEFLWMNTQKFPLVGNVAEGGIASQRTQYSHDVVTQRAISFLDEVHDQPFFLYLAYTLPHANNERGRTEEGGMEVPSVAPYQGEDWPLFQKQHAAMISRLDRDLGAILNRLSNLGLDQETIVFFTSDNGPHKEGGADPEFFDSNGPLQGYKRSLHDGGIRVPMIVRWPGVIEAGQTSDAVWAFWDVLPTLAELAGTSISQSLDGRSVVPALLGPERAGRSFEPAEFLYWEFHERGFAQAVRMGQWKAVREQLGPIELFDLTYDPAESRDLAEQHPEVVETIQTFLETRARTDDPAWPMTLRGQRRRSPK